MKLTQIVTVLALFAFSKAIQEHESGVSPALTVEQELALLVTGDVNQCTYNGDACSASSSCCSDCCRFGKCYD